MFLHLGAMHVDADVRLRGQFDSQSDNYGYRGDRFDFGDRSVPRIEGGFRFNRRNRVLFNYFSYQRGRQYQVDTDIEIDGLPVPVQSEVRAGLRFKLGTLVYDRALVASQHVDLGLQIGVAWGSVDGRVEAGHGPDKARDREYRNGFAPVLGARLALHAAEPGWNLVFQGQYVNADWGNLRTYQGNLLRANALLEYRLAHGFGLFAGYDAFRLDINRDFGTMTGGLVLRFRGPTAGISLTF